RALLELQRGHVVELSLHSRSIGAERDRTKCQQRNKNCQYCFHDAVENRKQPKGATPNAPVFGLPKRHRFCHSPSRAMAPSETRTTAPPADAWFTTTHWSIIFAAAHNSAPG